MPFTFRIFLFGVWSSRLVFFEFAFFHFLEIGMGGFQGVSSFARDVYSIFTFSFVYATDGKTFDRKLFGELHLCGFFSRLVLSSFYFGMNCAEVKIG